MGLKSVKNHINFTWPFIPEDKIKVFELDTNIMEFNFKRWITLNKIWEERPWSINGHLVVLYDYNREMVYQDLDWEHQYFWIQLKKLLPEHTNPPVMKKIGEIMGEIVVIELEIQFLQLDIL